MNLIRDGPRTFQRNIRLTLMGLMLYLYGCSMFPRGLSDECVIVSRYLATILPHLTDRYITYFAPDIIEDGIVDKDVSGDRFNPRLGKITLVSLVLAGYHDWGLNQKQY